MGTGTTLKQLWKSWTAQRIIIIIRKNKEEEGGAGAAAGVHIILRVIPIIMHNYSVKLIISLATSASTSRVVLEIEEENIINFKW